MGGDVAPGKYLVDTGGREIMIVGSVEEMRPEDRANLAAYFEERIPVLDEMGLDRDADRLRATVNELRKCETGQ